MTEKLVSIIVPLYNPTAAELRRCVQSLLSQTHQNLQIVLVDDGSAEEARMLCDALAMQDERLCVLHQPNAGVSAARNAGIALAKGEYLAFVDADDFVEPSFVKSLAQMLESNDLAICGIAERHFEVVQKTLSCDDFFSAPKPFTGVVYLNFSCNKMFHMELIRSHRLCFDASIHLGEDAVFLADYFPHCHQVACISEKLYHYCDSATSAMHRYNPDFWKWEETVITRQWALFAAKSAAPAQQAQLYQWLYLKLRGVFEYYLENAPKERQILRTIQASQVFERLMTHGHSNMGFHKKARLNLWLWRWFHTAGIVLGHRLRCLTVRRPRKGAM
ncbi:MAG: glycosyltransferase [Clostridia bacterium]